MLTQRRKPQSTSLLGQSEDSGAPSLTSDPTATTTTELESALSPPSEFSYILRWDS